MNIVPPSPPRSWRAIWFSIAFTAIAPLAGHGVEYTHRYEGDSPVEEALPPWRKSTKRSGGKAIAGEGKLRVEVAPDGRLYYLIGRGDDNAYNASSPEGSTIDFSVRVEAAHDTDEPFAIRVGTGLGSIGVIFRRHEIDIAGKTFPHDTTEFDVYRIAFRGDTFGVFSARKGEIIVNQPIPTRYPADDISIGTRGHLALQRAVVWELDFLRWTNREALFESPKSE